MNKKKPCIESNPFELFPDTAKFIKSQNKAFKKLGRYKTTIVKQDINEFIINKKTIQME